MIELQKKLSMSSPWSGSEALTDVPSTVGTGVGDCVGTSVTTRGARTVPAVGVAVGGGSVGRGVSRLLGFSEVVGAGLAGGATDSQPTSRTARTSNELQQVGNKCCPACLMTRTQASASVTVEELVEQYIVAPFRISLELLACAENRP